MFCAIAIAVGIGIGFGLGRVKNSAKLAAVREELNRLETGVQTEGKQVITAIRAKV